MTSERAQLVASLRDLADSDRDGTFSRMLTNEALHAAADMLEADAPDEREGRCWCGDCSWSEKRMEWWVAWTCINNETGDECGGEEDFCPGCGAELGSDGIARRHPAVRRLDQVHVALSELEKRYTHEDPDRFKWPIFSRAVMECVDYMRRDGIAGRSKEGTTQEAAIDAAAEVSGDE